MPYSRKNTGQRATGKTRAASEARIIRKTVAAGRRRPVPGAEYQAIKNGTHPRQQKTAAKERLANQLGEPEISYTSKIRAIGNSRGVILNNQLMEIAGIAPDADIVVHAKDGMIYIMEVKPTDVNTDLSTWDRQFKAAVKNGAKPDKDLFEGMENDFDNTDW